MLFSRQHSIESVHFTLVFTLPLLPTLVQIKYVEGGERAVANFEAGKAGYEARAFRGLGVFSSTPFEVSDGEL